MLVLMMFVPPQDSQCAFLPSSGLDIVVELCLMS